MTVRRKKQPSDHHSTHHSDHPFKKSANFHDSLPLPPSRRQFFTSIRRQIWPIFDPSPLKNADVLNRWSHSTVVKPRLQSCAGWLKDEQKIVISVYVCMTADVISF
jgi:hypothetical protein